MGNNGAPDSAASEAGTAPPSVSKSERYTGPDRRQQRSKGQAAECFVCPLKKKANSKWCPDHHRRVQSMLYQAEKAGEVVTFNDVMADKNTSLP